MNKKHGKNIPSVMIIAPANTYPRPLCIYPPWKPVKVVKIMRGTGKMLLIAMQLMKICSGNEAEDE